MTFLDGLAEDAGLTEKVNAHWRKVANYEHNVLPIIILLKHVDWPKLLALHRARWHLNGISSIRSRQRQYGRYCWGGRYFNKQTNSGRLIQRYPLFAGYNCHLSLPIPIPVESAQRQFEHSRAVFAKVYAKKIEQERRAEPNERKYLAERLASITVALGRSQHWDYRDGPRSHIMPAWEPSHRLNYFLEVGKPNLIISFNDPTDLGETQAQLDYFKLCLREFHEAEQAQPPAIVSSQSSSIAEVPIEALPQSPISELKYLDTSLMGGIAEMAGKAFADAEKNANAMGFTLLHPVNNVPVFTRKPTSITQSEASSPHKPEIGRLKRSGSIVSWDGLLRPPLDKHIFYKILFELGLLTPTGELTELGQKARPRTWAGIVAALRERHYIIHDYSATHKALTALGVLMGERSLSPTSGLSAEAENIMRITLRSCLS